MAPKFANRNQRNTGNGRQPALPTTGNNTAIVKSLNTKKAPGHDLIEVKKRGLERDSI